MEDMNAEKANRNRLIYEMRERGMTTVAIARELNLHWTTVSKVHLRWKKREEQKKKEEKELIHRDAT